MGNRPPPLRPTASLRSTFVLLAAVPAAPPVMGVGAGALRWLSLSGGLAAAAAAVILWLWRNMSHAERTVGPKGFDGSPPCE